MRLVQSMAICRKDCGALSHIEAPLSVTAQSDIRRVCDNLDTLRMSTAYEAYSNRKPDHGCKTSHRNDGGEPGEANCSRAKGLHREGFRRIVDGRVDR